MINRPDPHSQIQNDETPEAEYTNENGSEDTEIKKVPAVPTFMS